MVMSFLGCGDNGIDVRDIDGNELFSVDTSGPVQDLKIEGDYLYVAEENYGIEVYSVDKNGQLQLANTYRCTLKNETVTQLNITPDGKNMLAQDGWTRLSVLEFLLRMVDLICLSVLHREVCIFEI